jgi:hypothetical protein
MNQGVIDGILDKPLSQELLDLALDLVRPAFTGLGGTPRSIPVGFTWRPSIEELIQRRKQRQTA